MSIQLPKYTISTIEEESYKNPILLIIVALIIGLSLGFFGYKYYSVNSISTLQQRNDVLEKATTKQLSLINNLESQVSILKTEKKVKHQATLDLQQDYKKSIDINNNLNADVSFYERLLSPNAKNKGLRVFESEVLTQKDGNYLLKLILVQKIERARDISGKYEIYINGLLNDKPKSVQISLNSKTNFKFKYFHKVSLPFSLANGFKPESLVVKLFPKNNKSKTIEYTVDWQTLN